ncbi:MAG: helix-hairpin-helix domain-containing protein [Bacteroidota bacterium]
MEKLKQMIYLNIDDRRAVIAFLSIGYLMLLSPVFFKNFDNHEVKGEWVSDLKHTLDTIIDEQKDSLKLFLFDPNSIELDSMLMMGLPAKVCYTIDKYRKSGGTFYKAKDLLKIYGLDSTLYNEMAPFIKIPSKQPQLKRVKKFNSAKANKPSKAIKININEATMEEWKKLYGIGPAISKRIVNFRSKLGGFVSVDQVGETYGLADSTFINIKKQLFIDEGFLPQKIEINLLDIAGLAAHPYIQWKEAKAIFYYRMNHGPYENIMDLKKVKLISKEEVLKLEPYLSF